MPSLPVLCGREVVKAFESLSWRVARQKGSQILMVNEGHMATLSSPDHREVATGTVRGLIRAAELTVQDFISASSR